MRDDANTHPVHFVTVEQVAGGARPVQFGPATAEAEVGYVIFDRDQAMAQFGEDPDFLTEIVSIFLDEVATLLADGDSALEKGDSESLAKIAHRLKGAFGQMTAEEAQHAALAVEMAATDEDMAGIDILWADVDVAVDRLRPQLAEFTPA